jgi:hypothetical protein
LQCVSAEFTPHDRSSVGIRTPYSSSISIKFFRRWLDSN